MRCNKLGCFINLALGAWFLNFAGTPSSAQSISFDPAEGNALTPMIITVTGFIGTNGPAPVSVGGAGIEGYCSSARPCTFSASMGHFTGKQWVTASAMVDGVNVTVSNYFVVREAKAFMNRACGTNGMKVIVTGYDFGRNQTVYVDNTQTQADTNGAFAVNVTLNGLPNGPYNIIAQDGFHFVTNQITIGTNTVCEPNVGQTTGAGEGVTVTRPGGQPQRLKSGDPIYVGDVIQTGAGASCSLRFPDGTKWTLAPNTKQTIDAYSFDPGNGANDNSFSSLLEGVFQYTSGLLYKHDDNARIETAPGHIGIRGTEFISRRDPCSTTQEVYLIHGQLAIKPTYAIVTNIIDAPATIFYDATNVLVSALTQATYDALKNEITQTNPVTFAAWQVQYFGCTNGNVAANANADPDGDGQNNYAEFLARTDPTSSASVFRMLNAAREGDSIRLNWQTHGGTTNVLQVTDNLSVDFADLSEKVVIPGNEDIQTNYLDQDILQSSTNRFYRVRLTD